MNLIAHIDDDPQIIRASMEIGARVISSLRACLLVRCSAEFRTLRDESEKDSMLRAAIEATGELDPDYLDLASDARKTPMDGWAALDFSRLEIRGFPAQLEFISWYALKPTAPRLILQDLHLNAAGAQDGFEALANLRALLPSTPIVVLSQSTDSRAIAECYRRGANEFHFKGGTFFGLVMIRVFSHWLRTPLPK